MVTDAHSEPTIDLSRHVRPGSGIWWSQASAEPTVLVHALLDQADRRLQPVAPESLSIGDANHK